MLDLLIDLIVELICRGAAGQRQGPQLKEVVHGPAVAQDVHHPHGERRHMHRIAGQEPALVGLQVLEDLLDGILSAIFLCPEDGSVRARSDLVGVLVE